VLATPNLPDVVTVLSPGKDAPIHIAVRRHLGKTYVFAVAMRPTATEGTFRVNGGRRPMRVRVLGEDRTLPLKQRSFSDSFAPYGVHLYRIE
jgi:hypothetical protein